MKRAVWIVFLCHLITLAYGQSEVGITAGINGSSLYGERKNEASQFDYTHKIDYVTSIFYKLPVTEKSFVGIELENMQVKSGIQILTAAGYRNGIFYNAVFDLNYFNAHLFYGRRFFSIGKTVVSLKIGPYVGYLLQSSATGYYGNSGYVPMPGMQNTFYYEINETPAKDIGKYNVGLRLQVDAHIPLNDNLFILANASYCQGTTDVLYHTGYTMIVGYTLTTGLAYRFNKKNADETKANP